MKTYYHYTKSKHIEAIEDSLMIEDTGLGIYACDSLEDLFKFINFYVGNNQMKVEETKIIEFTSNSKFEESHDHDAKYFKGAKAFVFHGHVNIENIKNVTEIELKNNKKYKIICG